MGFFIFNLQLSIFNFVQFCYVNFMKHILTKVVALGFLVLLGCEASSDYPMSETKKPKPPPAKVPPAAAAKKVKLGQNVFLEVQGERRLVRVNASVCLRQGQLEQLLTRTRTKEHEAILAADVDARDIHTALTLARAEPGKPVQFLPKFQPPTGTTIKVALEYTDPKNKERVRVPAQHWIRNMKSKKVLKYDWVFAGSVLIHDPMDKTKKPYYAANQGDLICVSNFDTALLDLPVNSTGDNDDLRFEAVTDRIPPVQTPVQVVLEPVLKSQKK